MPRRLNHLHSLNSDLQHRLGPDHPFCQEIQAELQARLQERNPPARQTGTHAQRRQTQSPPSDFMRYSED